MMAKPKKSVLIEKLPNHLRVWCNNPTQWLSDLASIEGIIRVDNLTGGCTILHCDPRYDLSELAQEVEQLLMAEVPEVFKE